MHLDRRGVKRPLEEVGLELSCLACDDFMVKTKVDQ